MSEILIVDDEANIRRMLRSLLEAEGYRVRDVASGEAALTAAAEAEPDAVLLDLALPGIDGLETLERLARQAPGLPVVMMSGRATLSDAVRATRLGAFHFIEKPLTPEAVLLTVRGALEIQRARDLSRALREELGPGYELVGESAAMEELRALIRRVAPTEARVLITGESGTGKELAAVALHHLSARKGGPFVRVNSAAIPRDLVESEMFGHEKGAFSGATSRRRGRIELAHRGTLFLDEVADLGPEAQAKLLRAIETGVIERVGGNEAIEVDARVIAATHRDLRAEVEQGRFREDLLFRLEVVPIRIPPLRERAGDIPHLVRHAVARLRARQGLATPDFAADALERLQAYPWPGNVRELFNTVERLTILHEPATLHADDVARVLPDATGRQRPALTLPRDARSLAERLADYERTLILDTLHATGGSVAAAARRLDTDRANLYRRMRRLGIGPEQAAAPPFRPEE